MLIIRSLPILAGAAVAALIGLAPLQAQAFTLTSCELSTPPSNPCGTPPLNLGTIDVTQVTGTTNEVEIKTTLTTGELFANTGALNHEALEFFTSKSLTSFSATSSPTNFTFALDPITGGYSVTCDGTSTPCGGGTSPPNFSSLDVLVDVSSGTLSPSDFTTNGNGQFFLADVGIPCGGSGQPACTTAGTSFNTGVVDAVPAPVIGHGLFVLLAVSGVLFGGKFLESLKKHRLHAA